MYQPVEQMLYKSLLIITQIHLESMLEKWTINQAQLSLKHIYYFLQMKMEQ